MATSCNEWKPSILMIVIEFSFALVNILLKKVLDEGINHLVLITYRLFISTMFLAPFSYFWESAVVGTSLTQYCFLLGIQYTSATFACAFINIVPVITFIIAIPFGLEKVDVKSNAGRAKILGTLICVGGAMLLTLYIGPHLLNYSHSEAKTYHVAKTNTTKGTESWTAGMIALVIGTLLWSSWFPIQASIGKRYPCQYSSTAIMLFFGVIQSAILSMCINKNLSIWVLKGKFEIITVFYAGIVGSGLSYVGMSWCVKKRGPVFTAAFSPLVQIMTAMLDIPFLHEQLHLGTLLGSGLVIIGLYILLFGKNKESEKRVRNIQQEAEESKGQDQLQVITSNESK
ncbi:hypothetical protein ACFE04_007415 [Oxalis oulophora]